MEARGAFFTRDAKRLELATLKAASRPPVDAPAREHIEQRHLFG